MRPDALRLDARQAGSAKSDMERLKQWEEKDETTKPHEATHMNVCLCFVLFRVMRVVKSFPLVPMS
jgi:hypothetical protein